MKKPISTQAGLLEAAATFERKHPLVAFNVTTSELYNDRFEIRAYPAVAKTLVNRGLLTSTANVLNGRGNQKSAAYRLTDKARELLKLLE